MIKCTCVRIESKQIDMSHVGLSQILTPGGSVRGNLRIAYNEDPRRRQSEALQMAASPDRKYAFILGSFPGDSDKVRQQDPGPHTSS